MRKQVKIPEYCNAKTNPFGTKMTNKTGGTNVRMKVVILPVQFFFKWNPSRKKSKRLSAIPRKEVVIVILENPLSIKVAQEEVLSPKKLSIIANGSLD